MSVYTPEVQARLESRAKRMRRAREWVRTKLSLCDDSGRPYPNHVNEIAAMLDAVRDEALEEAAQFCDDPRPRYTREDAAEDIRSLKAVRR